jgi:hypothetical protein
MRFKAKLLQLSTSKRLTLCQNGDFQGMFPNQKFQNHNFVLSKHFGFSFFGCVPDLPWLACRTYKYGSASEWEQLNLLSLTANNQTFQIIRAGLLYWAKSVVVSMQILCVSIKMEISF